MEKTKKRRNLTANLCVCISHKLMIYIEMLDWTYLMCDNLQTPPPVIEIFS